MTTSRKANPTPVDTDRKPIPNRRAGGSSPDWFTVDRKGLAALVERKPKASYIAELIQNAWDEDGVTTIDVSLVPTEKRGIARLVATDDAPNGFADLSHAYSLFAKSAKIGNAEKRGRFNLGEKLVLSLCEEATIVSTRGGVSFGPEGRKTLRSKRPVGSEFSALIRMTVDEIAETADLFRKLLPPVGIETTFNGEKLLRREPIHSFRTRLRTLVADEGSDRMKDTVRETTVRLFEPLEGETSTIYEMGIPVVEWDTPFHADVAQKVPLTMERDNVTPSFLRRLRVDVLNESFDRLSKEEATEPWVSEALGDERLDVPAIRSVLSHRFGDNAVAFDPSDREANSNAILAGRTVVYGGSNSKAVWANARRAEVLLPAGKVTPSTKILSSLFGESPLDEGTWDDGMRLVADYAKRLARDLLDVEIRVDVRESDQGYVASYGNRTLTFNTTKLPARFFRSPDEVAVDELLVHEFAHERISNHLSEEFHSELCRLGAKLRNSKERLR